MGRSEPGGVLDCTVLTQVFRGHSLFVMEDHAQ